MIAQIIIEVHSISLKGVVGGGGGERRGGGRLATHVNVQSKLLMTIGVSCFNGPK